MANKSAVIVLVPNGRRQVVKVNPNSTILQIIEEVCAKQGLKADEYDIKHHNKYLDTSAIFRFSGLPNNAQLELAQAIKVRSEGMVTLGLQLESGQRIQGDFIPSNTLWDVLIELCPDEASMDTNIVIIYMRREIYGGRASFEDTTLRSLGLTNGRAMLRLIRRFPEELRTQANVSAPLPSKPMEEKPYVRKLIKSDNESSTAQPIAQKSQESKPEHKEEKHHSKSHVQPKKPDPVTQFIKQEQQKQTGVSKPKSITISSNVQPIEPMDIDHSDSSPREKTVAEEDFVFLGARNAMLFSQETAQAVPSEELPDDFFELTMNDAKKLLRDMKRRRKELENAPLATTTYKNLEQSKRELNQLNRYKQTIIRINFPNRTVLQGTFSPVDTIETVQDFVREYLEDKATDFYLYTAPPKEILNANSRLLEINCVPNAILHFGSKDLNPNGTYLRKDLINRFTTPSIASLAAAKMRKEIVRKVPNSQTDDDDNDDFEDASDVNVGASTSKGPTYEDYPARVAKESEKFPKWFKPLK